MRRLYHQLYLTIVLMLTLLVIAAGLIWRYGPRAAPADQAVQIAGEVISGLLPGQGTPQAEQQEAIESLSRRLRVDLALYDAARRPIAAAGRPLPLPPGSKGRGGWVGGPRGAAWAFELPDGRWLVARAPSGQRHPAFGLMLFLGALALAVALGAYPVVRRLTGRLERLQAGVEQLGAGDLKARVRVEGRDEVARLATSFNRAAARIEELVGSHRMLLANASHELRTPLSRLRLGVELLKEKADPGRKAELEADIAELDVLIDEILLASRLEAGQALEAVESIDLLGIAAEEASRYEGVGVAGAPAPVSGDPRLLRRLVRNLIDNSIRHGRPPVEVVVTVADARAELTVADAGAGVPAAERERVFEPFHRVAGRGDSKGSGLGLALVRQIARRHGGNAVCRDKAGGGSLFAVTLPLETGSSSPATTRT